MKNKDANDQNVWVEASKQNFSGFDAVTRADIVLATSIFYVQSVSFTAKTR